MNRERRICLRNLIEKIETAKSGIEMLLEEEQESYDNMPEGLQSSERGEKAENAIYALEEAIESLESCIESLETARE